MLRETFHYRRDRGCTRSDAACVAWSARLAAELSSIQAAAVEELLYALCSERRRTVTLEVICT